MPSVSAAHTASEVTTLYKSIIIIIRWIEILVLFFTFL